MYSLKAPINQKGITNVSKKIINQKPMVSMVRKERNPKYWSNSNIGSFYMTKVRLF